DHLGRSSNRTRGAPSPTRRRRSDARAAPAWIALFGSHLLLLRVARNHHRRGDTEPGSRPPGVPGVPGRLDPVRRGAVVAPAPLDRWAHGGREASRRGDRELTGRRCLCAAQRRRPDVGTQPPRSTRIALPRARAVYAPGGGAPDPDAADGA